MSSEQKIDYSKTMEKYRSYNQEHVLNGWSVLSTEQRISLLHQLSNVDLELIQNLVEKYILNGLQKSETEVKFSPTEVISIPQTPEDLEKAKAAVQYGEEIIRSGKVGLVLVAGGQGTRLGFTGPKGKYPVTPVKNKSLFQIHAEKVLALSRRYQTRLPWYIMTSEINDEETKTFFAKNSYFGLNQSDIFFFQQNMIPGVNESGKLLLQSQYRIFTNPDGHGGILGALKSSGALKDMANRGLEQFYYFQVDNVLLKICDPVFIGYHTKANSDMSCKVVQKKNPEEKVGVVVYSNEKLTVLEYSDLPKELMFARNEDGSLIYGAGNIAVHMLSYSFIEKLTNGSLSLPYHRAHKKIPYLNESGEKINPNEPNGYKFETFIFDALQYAANPVVMEVNRKEEFSPVKNTNGDNSKLTANQAMCNLFGFWFEKAGVDVPRDTATGNVLGKVEISPLYALDENEFVNKANSELQYNDGLYLG